MQRPRRGREREEWIEWRANRARYSWSPDRRRARHSRADARPGRWSGGRFWEGIRVLQRRCEGQGRKIGALYWPRTADRHRLDTWVWVKKRRRLGHWARAGLLGPRHRTAISGKGTRFGRRPLQRTRRGHYDWSEWRFAPRRRRRWLREICKRSNCRRRSDVNASWLTNK